MKRLCVFFLWVLLPVHTWGAVANARRLDLSELKLPPGFEITIYARGLGSARMMAVSPNEILFVSDLGGRVDRKSVV